MRRSEMCEVEGEDRRPLAFGKRHDNAVCVAEIEVGERCLQLDRPARETRRRELHGVVSAPDRLEERTGHVGSGPRTKQIINLHNNGLGDDELTAEFGYDLGGESVGGICCESSRD